MDMDMEIECSYAHLIFIKGFLSKEPKTSDGEKSSSLTNVAGKTGYLSEEN
jgi:hypothetical protein